MGWNAFVSLITLLFSIGLLGLIVYNNYLNQKKLKTIIFIFSILYIAVHFYNKRSK
jgi:ABC-type transport system involved in multi-copper enzyme maturation permease subunit